MRQTYCVSHRSYFNVNYLCKKKKNYLIFRSYILKLFRFERLNYSDKSELLKLKTIYTYTNRINHQH